MSLANPGIDYKAIRDSIINLLKGNLLTLNTNLTTNIMSSASQIRAGNPFTHPKLFFQITPTILIKIMNKNEEFAGLGGGARKRATISFQIYVNAQMINDRPDDEIMQIVKNIESIFRDNVAFGSFILFAEIKTTEFGLGEYNNTFFDTAEINVDCRVEVK